MAYNLIITERADELFEVLVQHLIYNYNSQQAATHLVNCVSKIYDRIQENPFQFPICKDEYLSSRKYREAIIPDMNYIIIYRVDTNIVYIVGIFHHLEDYYPKLKE
jgi:plasmid stabilization system protein ParE